MSQISEIPHYLLRMLLCPLIPFTCTPTEARANNETYNQPAIPTPSLYYLTVYILIYCLPSSLRDNPHENSDCVFTNVSPVYVTVSSTHWALSEY